MNIDYRSIERAFWTHGHKRVSNFQDTYHKKSYADYLKILSNILFLSFFLFNQYIDNCYLLNIKVIYKWIYRK